MLKFVAVGGKHLTTLTLTCGVNSDPFSRKILPNLQQVGKGVLAGLSKNNYFDIIESSKQTTSAGFY